MYMKLSIVTAILFYCYGKVSSYKILVVSPLPTKSIHILGKGIADILHRANHEVTFITPFPQKKPEYREIPIPLTPAVKVHLVLDFNQLSQTSASEFLMRVPGFTKNVTETMYQASGVQNLLWHSTEKFDLIVIQYTLNDGLAGLGVKFDCPVILVSSVSPLHWLARRTGQPLSPATVANGISSFSNQMTLKERILNTGMAIFQEIFGIFFQDPDQEYVYKKYLPEEAAKVPFSELYKKISLIYSNSHPSLGQARPLLPNVVEIAGYHLNTAKALPEEYQKILDKASDGVIFFSMGSNLKSAEMPEKLKMDILKALGKRKETVLWKYEEDLPNKPKNIIIRSWMPQSSILAHPNVKLFITHGGLLSTTEAAAAGVPLLAIPIFGDQFVNAKSAQVRGCGVILQYTNVTESSLTWALKEAIENPKYNENAKRIYQLFHDRPMNPKDLVVFYAEHVIKTGGANHLSAPYLPLYSSLLLDVVAVLLLPPLLIILVTIWMCKKCCGKSKTETILNGKQKAN